MDGKLISTVSMWIELPYKAGAGIPVLQGENLFGQTEQVNIHQLL